MKKSPRQTTENGRPRDIEFLASGVGSPWKKGWIAGFCEEALALMGSTEWEISILLCGDKRMQGLNLRYRGKDAPTDVLSFCREELPGGNRTTPSRRVAGDIAISLETLKRNAKEYGTPDSEEMMRLLVHGMLHLSGMDHGKGKGRAMLAFQKKLLLALHESGPDHG